MRHPFWILNSTLLVLLFIALDFIFFSNYKIPAQKSIEPGEYHIPPKKSVTEINIEKIYENDIFDTYVVEAAPPDMSVPTIITMPPPPPPHRITAPKRAEPQFLDPLKINLKGTILVSDDESKNRAIIEDEETGKERMYKISESIEDAKLLRIMPNKVILMRTNGQQEILYLREKDTKLDPLYATLKGWDTVLKKVDAQEYIIYPTPFVSRVTTLGQFIDMLDLTTVFKQGKTVGTRVGYLSENSLGLALGLQRGDIILSINGVPATTTTKRINIYRSIVSLGIGDTIKVRIRRGGQDFTIEYFLKQKNSGVSSLKSARKSAIRTPVDIAQEQQKLDPTAREIRQQEQNNMRNK
jgi:type II secretion system protein C